MTVLVSIKPPDYRDEPRIFKMRLTTRVRVDRQVDDLVSDIESQEVIVLRKRIDRPDVFVQERGSPRGRSSVDRSIQR